MSSDPLDKLRKKKLAARPDFRKAKLKALEIANRIPEAERGGSAYLVSKHLVEVGEVLDEAFAAVAGDDRVDWTLVSWTDGRAQYLSTTTRESTITALREMADMLERNEAGPPSHMIQG